VVIVTNSYETDEEKKNRLLAQLTNVDIGPGGVGASGRVSYKMPIDKESDIEAYADLEARKRKGEKISFASPMIGVGYTRRFKQGGNVKSASSRADGIAQRGKTKGRFV